jgi:eukaryotic-like serine/threonine-protein kinase
MSDALIGTMIAGKYRIHRLLGTGGMGAVYAGEHLEIGKRVAIKVIHESHANSPEVAARFRREARAASAVESASIVHVFDVGHDPVAGLYMVMEYLDGEDLAARLGREQKLSPEDVVAIGFQSCRALAKAHAAGVIHRDLKPANIYLTTRDDDSLLVKILDFGISKLLNDVAEASVRAGQLGPRGERKALTCAGSAIGTPQYMSPEQAQGLVLDARSDVWSMGACLYEALAGAPLYEELGTYEQTIIRVVTTRAAPLAQVAPWVPRALAEVVDAALVHDVGKRIPDCATFARRLKESVGDTSSTLRPSSTPVSPLSSTLSIDSFASTIALASIVPAAVPPLASPRMATPQTPQPDFSRTVPLRGLNVTAPLASHGSPLVLPLIMPGPPGAGTSTGTAVTMPEPTIPGASKGFPILLAVGCLLVAMIVVVAGIFVVTARSHTSAAAAASSATAPSAPVASSAPTPQPVPPATTDDADDAGVDERY